MELEIWTVYDHPSDFPDHYVARKWIAGRDDPTPTGEVITETDLDALRARLPEGLFPMPPMDGDDSKIIETWF